MANLLGVNLGLDPSNVLVSYLHVPAQSLEDHRRAGQTVEQMIAEVRSQPGVVAAAAIMGMPTGKYGSNGAYIRAGEMSLAEMNRAPNAGFRVNSPQFFATMKIPLLKGREFTPNDTADSPPVAIVNQALVKLTFPNEDPIGKQLICGLDSIKPMTIVGVVGDVRHAGPATPPGPEIYMPLAQHPFYANEVQLAIRAERDPRPFAETMRALAARHNHDIAVNSLLLSTMVEDSVSSSRFRSLLLLTLSAIALTLAAAGVYGVLAYLVNLRLSEFGLRRALGASAGSILKLVAREAGLLFAIGTALGLALTLALEQYLRSFLFGISSRDGATIAFAVCSLAAMALLAAAAPSLAAARVDPMRVLRSE